MLGFELTLFPLAFNAEFGCQTSQMHALRRKGLEYSRRRYNWLCSYREQLGRATLPYPSEGDEEGGTRAM